MPKNTGQIKTRKRVRDFGEVFTNEREVKAMCDLIPTETWENITSTFLEPCCGNGNFLVEIYRRKLERCENEKDGLKALASIFAIDIQTDNVQESRARLKAMYLDKFPNASDFALYIVDLTLKNNIRCGDSLKIMEQWEEKQ